MKKIIVLLLIGSSYGFYKVADTIITQLGMDEQTAHKAILNNFVGDFADGFEEDNGGSPGSRTVQLKEFRIPYARLLPAVIKGDKTKAAKDLCEYIKAYVSSADFAKAYAEKRDKNKPTSEPWRPDENSIKEQDKQMKDTEKEIAKLRASKQVPEATLKTMEDAIADQRKSIAAWKDPTPNKSKWEKKYPENPAVMIKSRLEEYIALAATVNFDAAVSPGTKKKFTNAEYESKSLKWKAIYRAGKDVNAVAITFAKNWLKEL